MVTLLRFFAYSIAGAGYFELACNHGGWYWMLSAYIALEMIALWMEQRNATERTDENEQRH